MFILGVITDVTIIPSFQRAMYIRFTLLFSVSSFKCFSSSMKTDSSLFPLTQLTDFLARCVFLEVMILLRLQFYLCSRFALESSLWCNTLTLSSLQHDLLSRLCFWKLCLCCIFRFNFYLFFYYNFFFFIALSLNCLL